MRNRVQCKLCRSIIESVRRHDFVTCSCGAVSIDGGQDYHRRIGEPKNFIELDITEPESIDSAGTEEWDEYNRNRYAKTAFPEAFDMIQQVMDLGGKKHGYGSFLDVDNKSMQPKADFASRARHAAQDYAGDRVDSESEVLHLAHEATRCLMRITRIVRGIE